MSATTDFVAAQNQNRRNTMVLLAALTLLAGGIGYLVGALMEGESSGSLPAISQVGIAGAGLMAAVSIGWSAISLAVGDKMVLSMAGAKEIDKQDAPQLYNVVEEISIAAGVPMPRVMVLETDALNAFATGNRIGSGTIAVTRGLLNSLTRDELQGVVAHEMAHLANLDTRYMVVVGVTVGLIALVCDMALRTMNLGRMRSSASMPCRRAKSRRHSGSSDVEPGTKYSSCAAPVWRTFSTASTSSTASSRFSRRSMAARRFSKTLNTAPFGASSEGTSPSPMALIE